MNHIELKTARKLIGLSASEAAELIGNMTERSWKYLESGGRPIPKDISDKIEQLLSRRREILTEFKSLITNSHAIAIPYYNNVEDSLGDLLNLRFGQSLASTLCHDYGATLVVFNRENYEEWLGGNEDTQEHRAIWATEAIA